MEKPEHGSESKETAGDAATMALNENCLIQFS
jgi:hypothetical protein